MRMHITVAALAALAIATPAAAQGRVAHSVGTPVMAPAITFDTVQVERARRLLDRAERRWEAYDLKGARRAYREAAQLMQEQQVYAGPALVSLAYVTYAAGLASEAGESLVDAAAEAARYGDLELEATSLYEASIAFAEAGDMKRARALRADVARLLGSPLLPDAVKVKLQTRIALGE